MKSSIQDEAEGKWHQVKGKIKQVAGKAVGNRDLEAEGEAENVDRGDSMAYQQLHTDAGHHKENPQCRCGHSRDLMAIECLRGHRLPPRDSYREVKDLKKLLRNLAASSEQSSTVRNSVYFLIRSLTPTQATGNALPVAVQIPKLTKD
jgi:hypothetical protein